jgi:hypothetical protein
MPAGVSKLLTSSAAPLYKAASAQFRKLTTTLQRLEKISQIVLKLQAESAKSK